MYISRLILRNWRNFTKADVEFGQTTYLIGPNASGKSNFLDVFRFLRDIAKPQGGGLQQALASRGGLTKVRSLAARKPPQIEIELHFREELETLNQEDDLKYILWIKSEGKGLHRPVVMKEEAWKSGKRVLSRPDRADENDPERLTETHLEQTGANKEFRDISEFFKDVLYLHLVPQLLKFSDQLSMRHLESDPFGQGFLEEIAKAQERTRKSRLLQIEKVLLRVIPNFQNLKFEKDKDTGRPHLEMLYKHWRPNAGWQREDQFSDGTLRLIAIIWMLLTSNNLILLEEPELSLHKAIVEQIPKLIYETRQYRRKSGGQLLISTHSEIMLQDTGIDGQFLMLLPGDAGEATIIRPPDSLERAMLREGMSPADVLLQLTSATVGRI